MAVVSNVISSNLRLTNQAAEHISSLRNVRTDVTGQQVAVLMDGFAMIHSAPLGNVFLVVTNELTQE